MIQGTKYALVAGGAGFIGSHLVESLINSGWTVDVIDNFVTGNVENLRPAMEKAQELPDRSLSLKIISVDVVRLSVDPCRADEQPCAYDVVYNLACPASPKAYQANPLDTMLTNVVGTANLLSLAEAHQAVFVQASTSEIYGDPLVHPQKETYWGHVNSYGPRSCYDEGKRAAETLCYDFRKRNVDVRVARIFNTYGPRLTPMTVASSALSSARRSMSNHSPSLGMAPRHVPSVTCQIWSKVYAPWLKHHRGSTGL
jgi:UDP-glucuronate decarboxylase